MTSYLCTVVSHAIILDVPACQQMSVFAGKKRERIIKWIYNNLGLTSLEPFMLFMSVHLSILRSLNDV